MDTTPLIRPAPKRVEKVLGKYDFEGSVSNFFTYDLNNLNNLINFTLLKIVNQITKETG